MIKNFILSGCVLVSGLFASNEVNLYSHRHYDADKQLFKTFEKETGIKVNVVNATASALIKRLESEGKYTRADILMTADVARLVQADDKDLLQKISSDKLNNNVPANLRAQDGTWYALTKRARVIVYDKTKTDPKMFSTYGDLTSPKWKKKILIRKASNVYNQSLLASFIATDGERIASEWAAGIVNNMARKPAGNDRDQMKAVVAGIGELAIVNTYYVGNLLNSKDKFERTVGERIGVFFPNQGLDERGTHINVSGAGVVKWSKNKENAIKLLEFLTDVKAQELFAKANYEYPVNPKVEPTGLLKSWGTFKEDTTQLELFGKNNAAAVRIFNRVGWK